MSLRPKNIIATRLTEKHGPAGSGSGEPATATTRTWKSETPQLRETGEGGRGEGESKEVQGKRQVGDRVLAALPPYPFSF
jgi:hypothetical protein